METIDTSAKEKQCGNKSKSSELNLHLFSKHPVGLIWSHTDVTPNTITALVGHVGFPFNRMTSSFVRVAQSEWGGYKCTQVRQTRASRVKAGHRG